MSTIISSRTTSCKADSAPPKNCICEHVTLDIRDQWTNKDCKLQQSFRRLHQTVGSEIECIPDWPQLWTELQPFFPELGTFIPNVSSIVTIWCNSFHEFVRDEHKEQEWVEKVEEALSNTNKLRIFLEVGQKELPSTKWEEGEAAFIIFLPKAGPKLPSDISSSLRPDILACFTPTDTFTIGHPSEDSLPEDSWADINVDSNTGRISTQAEQGRAPKTASVRPATTPIPDVYIMERPEYLMLKPPYHLTISSNAFQSIVIQCSHPPTLVLLEKYLKKWTKRETNHRKQLPGALMTLKESPFGLAATYNALEVQLQDNSSYVLAPTFIVSIVQSMLGYNMTREDHGYWAFRKDVAFRG